MGFDEDMLVSEIVAFLEFIKNVRMTIPKQHEEFLRRFLEHSKSGTVGERRLCVDIIRETKSRFITGDDFQKNWEMVKSMRALESPLSDAHLKEVFAALTPAAPPQAAKREALPLPKDFLSIAELATRWRCSRGTVYNRLRAVGANALDFSARGKRSRKAVSLKTIIEIESRQSKRVR